MCFSSSNCCAHNFFCVMLSRWIPALCRYLWFLHLADRIKELPSAVPADTLSVFFCSSRIYQSAHDIEAFFSFFLLLTLTEFLQRRERSYQVSSRLHNTLPRTPDSVWISWRLCQRVQKQQIFLIRRVTVLFVLTGMPHLTVTLSWALLLSALCLHPGYPHLSIFLI